MSNFEVSGRLQNNYDNYYENSDSEWRRLGAVDKADNIQSLCESFNIQSAIEIGAGDGALLKELADRNFAKEFFALEISSSGAKAINLRNIPTLKQCLTFDGYCVPYNDNQFDLAILSHVLEHVEYPRKLIYEAKRIAKYVYIEVPCENNARLPMDFVLDKVGHINFYSPKTIRRLLQTCDLEVINQLTTNPSKSIYTYQKGEKGIVSFFIKQALLTAMPNVATAMFTYHSSLICKNKQ